MLTCQKHLYDLEPHVHYINGAYMSPLSRAAAAAGEAAIRDKMRPYHITPADFFTDVDHLKQLFAQIINAKHAHQVALTPSVSYGMATVCKNVKIKKGQNIVIAEAQFPSNVYPWRLLAKEKNCTIKTVPYPIELQNSRGKTWNQRVLEAIDSQTRVVTLSHTHWANGTIFDLKSIGKRCKEVGAVFVIDGTQSVGAMPIDVQDFGIDALICGGYKWLMGAYSLGYAYFGEAFANGKPLEEAWTNRTDAENFAALIDYKDTYKPLSIRYDMGEKSNFINVPINISALKQLLDIGIDNIQNYCYNLTAEAVQTWISQGYWVEEAAYRGGHLFGIQLPKGVSGVDLLEKLKKAHIYVSMRGDFVRISPNVYNDKADIDALTAVLMSAAN